ncbi:MAG: hypothetical protein U5L96_03375 [Owenweeksia sp.]|nr:hypothetical protein [Owenweeksia sp.]
MLRIPLKGHYELSSDLVKTEPHGSIRHCGKLHERTDTNEVGKMQKPR